MIKKEILFFLVLPIVVSPMSLGEVMLLLNQRPNPAVNNQIVNEGDRDSSQSEPDDTTEVYEALTPQPPGLNEQLMSWLYDEKVDELIHHLEALENLTHEYNNESNRNQDSDSEEEESDESDTGKPRSKLQHAIQNCGLGKVCIGHIQPKKFNGNPAIKTQNIVFSADEDESAPDETDSSSSYERSVEAVAPPPKPIIVHATNTKSTTTDDISKEITGRNQDNAEWIPYKLLNNAKDKYKDIEKSDIIHNDKFSKIGPVIFKDNIEKVKDSNEYTVKDIRQVIITNPANGEPKGIIVAEDRKFSLDYIDLDDLRAFNEENMKKENKKNSVFTQKQNGNNKRQRTTKNNKRNKISAKDPFRKSTKDKIFVKRSDSKKNKKTTANETVAGSALRTKAQMRKKQKNAEKEHLRKKTSTRKPVMDTWDDSDDNNSDEDNDSSPKKSPVDSSEKSLESSDATGSSFNKPKRFQIAKTPKKPEASKKKVSKPYTPVITSSETFEQLSQEVTTKKVKTLKRLKSKSRIPGKPEHYIQSYSRLYKEGEDFRKRLPQFLPKRYHWHPDDFTHLGYFWFNGHQGENPPGNFKIAY